MGFSFDVTRAQALRRKDVPKMISHRIQSAVMQADPEKGDRCCGRPFDLHASNRLAGIPAAVRAHIGCAGMLERFRIRVVRGIKPM
jgi:hypothetical protein